jgi:hypothetical protein
MTGMSSSLRRKERLALSHLLGNNLRLPRAQTPANASGVRSAIRTSSESKAGLTRSRARANFRSSSKQYPSPWRVCTRKQKSHPFSVSLPAACFCSAARYFPRISEGFMIALVRFSCRWICSVKSSSSHEGRVGFGVPAWEERADSSGQPTQIFDGPV